MINTDLVFIGIDDTDNLETRGTGFRARQLIELLQEHDIATGVAVTRHQLLVDDRVPYTSHNSSACLVVKRQNKVDDDQIMGFCRSFLLEIAAEGSDVGLCMATYDQALEAIRLGQKAKLELVTQDEARTIAQKNNIRLEGLTGDHQGIIGSLSAVGLHVYGNDGRYIWPVAIREYADKTVPVTDLKKIAGIEKVSLFKGEEINDNNAQIILGEWPRTVRIDNKAVLLVEKHHVQHQYRVLEKEIIKSIRP